LRKAWDVLEETQQILERVQKFYYQPFTDHIVPFLHQAASNITIRMSQSEDTVDTDLVEAAIQKFRRSGHAAFIHSLPPARFSKTFSYMLYDAGCKLFRLRDRQGGVSTSTASESATEVRIRMTNLLTGLERVGLGQENAQRALAHAMNKLLDTFISSHYLKVDWYTRTSVVSDLRSWIENGFCPLVELVMECLRCDSVTTQPLQLKQWQEMALARLGRARVGNLFDFVINWDQSLGAILDLKVCMNTLQ